MPQYMHMARVPEGEERDYIRGLLAFKYNNKGMIWFGGIYVFFSVVLFKVALMGKNMHAQVEVKIILGSIFCFLMSAVFFMLGVWCIISGYKLKKREDNYKYLKVCDVHIIHVLQTSRILRGVLTHSYWVKVRFEDGTDSACRYEAPFYPRCNYKTGLLVYVLDRFGNCVRVKFIPQCKRGTKAYKLAVRGFKKLKE